MTQEVSLPYLFPGVVTRIDRGHRLTNPCPTSSESTHLSGRTAQTTAVCGCGKTTTGSKGPVKVRSLSWTTRRLNVPV